MGVSAFSLISYSQVIFKVLEPANISKRYPHSNNGTGSSWGLANLNDPAVAVLDTVVVADDGTPGVNAQGNPASATACTAFAQNAYAGKIVMVFRGDGAATNPVGACSFGVKALNCQNAGAVAVIVVNRDETVFNMQGGTEGLQVNIPVVGVTLSVGKAILEELKKNVPVRAFIGNKQGQFPNDLAIVGTRYLRPNFGAFPKHLIKDSNDARIKLGSWVFNVGSNDNSGSKITAKITSGSTVLYNKTVNIPNMLINDSAFIAFPDFAFGNYVVGKYNLEYSITSNTADLDADDNIASLRYDITDSLFTMAGLSDDNKIMNSSLNTSPSPAANEVKLCTIFRHKNAGSVFAEGVQVRGPVTNANRVLTNITLKGSIYSWEDKFESLDSLAFDNVNIIDVVDFKYTSNNQDSAIYFKFSEQIPLKNNDRYLVCLEKLSADTLFFAFDDKANYTENIDTAGLISSVYQNSTNRFLRFSGTGSIAPAVALKVSPNFAAIEENKKLAVEAYPNPTNSALTVQIPTNGKGTLVITDLSGKEVAKERINVMNKTLNTNVDKLTSGAYIFNIQFDNGQSSQFKIVVAK